MAGMAILGTGRHLPGRPYTNDDLARVMDTNDPWIYQRTGIKQRHYCPEGVGVAELAVPAAEQALAGASLGIEDIDYVLFNTMTPDHMFPGSGPLLCAKLGNSSVPAMDLRTQCAAMLYSFQVADSMLRAGAAKRILVVGAEAHACFMPWKDWDILEGTNPSKPSAENWAYATAHRGLAILFGDGAGAMVLGSHEENGGILGADLHSDGGLADRLLIPAGFRSRPWVSEQTLASDAAMPVMAGRDLFRHAVTKLPQAVRVACRRAKVGLDDIDWFIAHQANARINAAVRNALKIPREKVPSNIHRYGNTSAATIPILLDEMHRDERLKPGQLVCFLALGTGLHWGAIVARL